MNDLGWPFADPQNVAVFTVADIMSGRTPILRVCHEEQDGAWQFLTGAVLPDAEKWMLIGLSEVVAIDSSIKEIADLPYGWEAVRCSPAEKWTTRPQNKSEEE
jgi:hypothetical protein